MLKNALKGSHLSIQQHRLWSFQPGNKTYRSESSIYIKGVLNCQVFQQALQQLVEQHTIFQTVFYPLPGMDVPIQIMGHHIEFRCPIINLEGIAESGQHLLLDALLKSQQEVPFDLVHGPLFRFALFRLSVETTLLYISLSALCADSSTLPLLIADLMKRYNACLSHQELAEEPLQYAAVSAWLKQLLVEEDEGVKVSSEFWQKFDLSQLVQVQQALEQAKIAKQQSLLAPRETVFEPCTLPLAIDKAVSARVHVLASEEDVSVEAILLTCWLILLHRLMDESQLVIGVAGDGRNYEELVEALGPYTRFVPFSAHLKGDWTFKQALAFIEPALKRTMEYQSYFSWPSLADTYSAPTEPAFFPVTFEYEVWPDVFSGDQVSLSLDRRFCCFEPFLLKISFLQVGENLQFELLYDLQNVTAERAARLASMLQELLRSVVEQPGVPIDTLILLTNGEQSQLLAAFRTPACSLPTQVLHQLFEEHVRRSPNQLAIVGVDEQLTYQQLNERANRLAWVLRRRGLGPNTLAGLCMTRSAQMLVGLLGILKAGGAYLPLDAGNPPARLLSLLQQSQAVLLLTQQDVGVHWPQWGGETLHLEDLEQEMAQSPTTDLLGGSEAEDLAYVIYTSGSTGAPKGVMIQQRSIVNYALAVCEQLQAEPGWHYATVSTLAADLGNTAIFCALVSGGCVQILDYETVTSAQAMIRWVELHPVDVLKIVPTHLSALLAEECSKRLLPHQALILGGEIFPISLLKQIREAGSTCNVYNHYGPTETTIGVLVNPLGVLHMQEEEEEEEGISIPLGSPIANTDVYVLDRWMQVVPVGVTGELYIGGPGLAMGYVRQGEQTANCFVPHPYSKRAGDRLYRTGDLTLYNEEGKIEFVGRRDSQVKLRGYRIELAEIEARLRQHPNVRDSVVVLQEDLPGSYHLTCYIVPRKLPVPARKDLQDTLRQNLPEYMVPSTFVYLKFLPLTANGKVDRRLFITNDKQESNALPYLIDLESKSRVIVQPRDLIELYLLQIWEDVLEIQPLSIFDDFFGLGGHSLLAVRLISRLAKQFGQHLGLATLFRHPTIAALAVILRRQVTYEEQSPLIAIQPQGSKTPFFCIHPAGGTAFCYVNLARCLGADQPFYGLQTPDQWRGEEALGTVEEMAAYYLAAIQTVQPQGPYLLGGWSAGGIVAFEMAQQLQRRGEEVSVLAIIDSSITPAQIRANAVEEKKDLEDTGIVKELLHHFRIIPPADFDQRDLEEQLNYVIEQAKKLDGIPVDTSPELVRRYTRIHIMNKHIVRLYIPQSSQLKIDYFASSNSQERTASLGEGESIPGVAKRQEILQDWRKLAKGGLEVHLIPGSHIDMVEEPHVQVLARELRHCIDRSCQLPLA